MTNNKQHLNLLLQKAIEEVYQLQFPSLEIQFTRKEFEGDYTLVVFPLIKTLKKKPEQIGQEIGEHLLAQKKIASYNVVKGFLNIELLPSTIVSLSLIHI